MTQYFGSGWEVGDILLRRELVAQGFSDADIHAMVRRGELRRITYGVLAVGPAPEDPRVAHAQRAAGIARLHGAAIALSHHSALVHYDLPLDGYVDLAGPVNAVRLAGGTSSSMALTVWRPRTSVDQVPLEGGGLVAPPVLAALQVATHNPLTPAVVVLDACLNARLFTPEGLHSAAAALNRTTGISRVRVAVSRCRTGAQSPRETELRLFVEDLGYETETQFPVSVSPDQPPFAHTDLRIRGTRALLEYDGEEKYEGSTAAPLLAERSRERRIERLGWRVERVVARDLRNRRALARRVHMMVQEWPETG